MPKIRNKKKEDPFSVAVEIECSQVITYKQTVMMRPEDYEKVKDLHGDDVSERRESEAYYVIQNYINTTDVYDTPNSEYEFVTVNKTDDAK